MTEDARLQATTSPVKRALQELRDLRARLDAAERATRQPVAIVGIGCRFPGGAHGADRLWELLSEGRDAIGEIPSTRFDVDAWYDPDPATPGRMATRFGGFLDDIAGFDAAFFGISPREAAGIDPQHRLVLEVAWEALEDAGIAPDRVAGTRAGVFLGIAGHDYAHKVLARAPEAIEPHLAQGIVHSAASGRLAYLLGLRGPAISMDTACSSSLVAVHQAVQSLRRGECDLAIAGGVNAVLAPDLLVAFTKAGMMAPDGRCKAFDSRADGFVRAEGCGLVVLRRADDATARGDRIRAVIRGSAINQDGRSSGMTAPNGPAQEAVIRAALADAGAEPDAIAYVETHGTGTALGDPIEAMALGAVLATGTRTAPCHLGAIKTHLGHLEAAAGVAGLIKAVLVLEHGEIPPNLHLIEPSPHIPWDDLPLDLPRATMALARDGSALAGVSSFGFTGTNAHLVLAPAPATADAPPPSRPLQLLKLSAKGDRALAAQVAQMVAHLGASRDSFADICASAAVGRADLPDRLVVVAADADEAKRALETDGELPDGVLWRGRADPAVTAPVFLFTGHGAQHAGMGAGLMATEAVFRDAIERCAALFDPLLDRPLARVLADPAALDDMTHTQPALFALQYALSELWRSWGVRPAAVLGHSVGEYAAAVVAGALSLDDAARLVAARGRLMDSLPEKGAMLAVFTTEAALRPLLADHAADLAIAAINAPTEIVVSGRSRAIDALADRMLADAIDHRRLAVAQAAHSPVLDPILAAFEAVAAGLQVAAPEIELVSCTTARPVRAEDLADPGYWTRHLRRPVRFADALAHLVAQGFEAFVEIGPDPRLCAIAARGLPEGFGLWVPSLREGVDDPRQMLEGLAALHVRGVAVDWAGFVAQGRQAPRRPHLRLPTYPWQHVRHWVEATSPASIGPAPDEDSIWEALRAAGDRAAARAPLDLPIATIPARWACLDRLTTAIVADTIARLGGTTEQAIATTPERLCEALGILPAYRVLVARWRTRLAASPTPPGLAEAWSRAEAELADWPFLLDYLRGCARLLPDVLTGRESPLETMFPGGSFAIAEQLYRDWALVRYFNDIVARVVEALARARNRPLRVLEIGAGTGGTTTVVLPALAEACGHYLFTDVAPHFLARAAETFAGHDALHVAPLDIARDPGEQGIANRTFDLVIAANALHATPDLVRTLGHVRDLLAPGGALVAFEVTRHLDWFDVSTALLEGWSDHSDELRPDHPLMSAPQWCDLLHRCGFARITAWPGDDSPAAALGQHVLVAKLPGTAPAMPIDVARPSAETAPLSVAPESARVSEAASLRARLSAAIEEERVDELVAFVRRHIAALLRLPPEQVPDRRARLVDLGLDSLMAVELRSRLGKGLELADPLPATLIYDHPSIEAIVALLARRLAAEQGESATVRSAPTPMREDAVAPVDEDDIEARLRARLEALEGRGGGGR